MSNEEDWQSSGDIIKPEHHDFPGVGYLSYDPNTLFISDRRDGQRPITQPVKMTGKFFGTRQPHLPTCSEPGAGNKGCSKWHGCRIGQMWKHVGPGQVVMRKLGTVTNAQCTDFFESTNQGRPTSQNHYGLDGFKLDTTCTTIDVLGRDWAIKAGILNDESSREKIMATRPRVGPREVGDLLPPWWPLLKEKGLPLPEAAEHYPELAEKQPEKPKKVKRG